MRPPLSMVVGVGSMYEGATLVLIVLSRTYLLSTRIADRTRIAAGTASKRSFEARIPHRGLCGTVLIKSVRCVCLHGNTGASLQVPSHGIGVHGWAVLGYLLNSERQVCKADLCVVKSFARRIQKLLAGALLRSCRASAAGISLFSQLLLLLRTAPSTPAQEPALRPPPCLACRVRPAASSLPPVATGFLHLQRAYDAFLTCSGGLLCIEGCALQAWGVARCATIQ